MSERYSRQRRYVPASVKDHEVHVIGVGATGLNVAKGLACIGVERIHIWDDDVVDTTNVSTQGYRDCEVDCIKVEAATDHIMAVSPQCQVTAHNERWTPRKDIGDIVFSCADSMMCRSDIWGVISDRALFLGDSRIQGETIRIIAADKAHQGYRHTLFSDEDAEPETCGHSGVWFSGAFAASMLVQRYTLFLRQRPFTCDTLFNLQVPLAMDMSGDTVHKQLTEAA